jgi:3-isopropylmalate dehydrogenase
MPYRIVVLPGDGIGPEVIQEGLKVLSVVEECGNVKFQLTHFECGAHYYEKHGREWEPEAFEVCRESDAMLLGAVGLPGVNLPSGEIAGAGIVFGLRFGLDLYANVRPVRLYPGVLHKIGDKFMKVWEERDVDFVIVRENTEGLYTPMRGTLERAGASEVTVDTRVITRKGSERISRVAFVLSGKGRGAPRDGKRRVTCVHKNNVLAGCRLFVDAFDEVGRAYPHIEKDHALVDAFAQWMMRTPESYDVCVTTNMFGDILTDLASVLQGGMGMAASGNIGERHAMFEPVHGSAPKYGGKDVANPIAAISSIRMMVDWLGETRSDKKLTDASGKIERAIAHHLKEGKMLTYDLGGHARCSEVGDSIAKILEEIYSSS